jgi:transposase
VTTAPENLSGEIAALAAALSAERTARQQAEARASSAEALVAHLKLLIAKLRRERFGQSSERGRKLLDQLELQLEELAASAAEDEIAAAPTAGTAVHAFTRRKPARAPFPAHLPRERVVIPGPTACPCCGGKLAKLGETITETLEMVPRQWKVIQTVREKFTCRVCEKITQPPAPFHVIARARAGASLLATILYAKFGEHQPLNRQSESYAREGIELDVSTLADWVGTCTASLAPLIELIRDHVLAAEPLHGDDTTVPVLAKEKTITGRVLHPGDPAALRAALPQPGGADPNPLPEGHLDRRFRGDACRPARQGCAGPVGLDYRAAEGGLARRARALEQARSVGQALCLCVGRRHLPAGPSRRRQAMPYRGGIFVRATELHEFTGRRQAEVGDLMVAVVDIVSPMGKRAMNPR